MGLLDQGSASSGTGSKVCSNLIRIAGIVQGSRNSLVTQGSLGLSLVLLRDGPVITE